MQSSTTVDHVMYGRLQARAGHCNYKVWRWSRRGAGIGNALGLNRNCVPVGIGSLQTLSFIRTFNLIKKGCTVKKGAEVGRLPIPTQLQCAYFNARTAYYNATLTL
eukprot:3934146-Amphidinium_carterae.2